MMHIKEMFATLNAVATKDDEDFLSDGIASTSSPPLTSKNNACRCIAVAKPQPGTLLAWT